MTAWVGQQLVARVGESRTRLIVLMMLLVAVLTALISVNGAVAALLPVAVVMAVRLRRSPSQLLLPLAFGAHAGLAARADRDAGQRDRLRGRATTPASAASASSRSRSSACRSSPGRSRSSSSSASGCCRTRTPRSGSRDFSDARAHADRAVRARPTTRRAAHAPLRRRRGRDPAALGARRRRRVPGHGHRERRPRRPRRAAQGRGAGPARRCSRSATRCCCRARGARSTTTSTTPRCSSSTSRELVRRQAVPLGAGRQAGARRARRRWSSLLATGAVPPAVAGLLAAGAIVLARRADDRAGLPRHLVDDRVLVAGMIPLSTAMIADRRGGSSSPTRSSTSSATPGRTRCCSACSCSPPCSGS